MSKIKAAVIGVGYLGQYHAEKYASSEHADLVAVFDTDHKRAEEIAERLNCLAIGHYHELIGQVDAVSIATPTPYHHEVALFFLRNGVHVLVEKPITTTVAEADELIQMAEQHNTLLQVIVILGVIQV